MQVWTFVWTIELNTPLHQVYISYTVYTSAASAYLPCLVVKQDVHFITEDVFERILDDKTAAESKTLIGHSGPVYGASFNYDNSLLLTSSEDKTVRLWSLFTYTNIVCYKGHNYPVWDVQFR